MKKPTMRSIAEQLNLSPASISMILNGRNLSRFSDETIEKVYQASRELGYSVPKNQKYKHCQGTILIICPSVMNPYYATLIQGMEQEARSQNQLTLLFNTYWNKKSESEILELASNPMISGIIFSMIPQQPRLVESIARRIPTVAVGDRTYELQIDTVDVNNYKAGCMVAEHLLHLGHKHIAYVSTALNSEHSSRVKRCTGIQDTYAKECADGKVAVYTMDISSDTELMNIDIEHKVGYELARKCLSETPDTTAIVAINDMVAYGVLDALKDAGKKVPEEISVCGFDNIYPSGFHGIELTSVEHAIAERGRSSVRLLLEKIRGNAEPSSNAFTRVEYQSSLMIRSTTQKISPKK